MAKINTVTTPEVEVSLPTVETQVFETMEVKAVETVEKLFEVKLKVDFNAYLGNGWVRLKKGTNKVPEYIKDHLKRLGLLEAI